MKMKNDKEIVAILVTLIAILITFGFIGPMLPSDVQAVRIHHTSCSVNGQPVDCGGP